MRSPKQSRSPAQPQRKLTKAKSATGKGACGTAHKSGTSPKKKKKTVEKLTQKAVPSKKGNSKVTVAKVPVSAKNESSPLKRTATLASGRSSSLYLRGSATRGRDSPASPEKRPANVEAKQKSAFKPLTTAKQPTKTNSSGNKVSQNHSKVTRHNSRQPRARITQLITSENVSPKKSQKTEELCSSDEDEEVSFSTQIRRSSRSSSVAKGGSPRLGAVEKKDNQVGAPSTLPVEEKNKNCTNRDSLDTSRRSARSQSVKPKTNAASSGVKGRESSRSKAVQKGGGQGRPNKTLQLDKNKGKSKSENKSKSCKYVDSASDSKDNHDTRVTRRNTSGNAKVIKASVAASKGRGTPISISTDEEDTQESNIVEVDDSIEDSESEVPEVQSDTSDDSDVICKEDENRKHKMPLRMSFKALKAQHDREMKAKDEELQQLRHELDLKGGQLAEMKTLIATNLELNARISAMLSDPEVYESEFKNFHDSKGLRDVPKSSKPTPDVNQEEGKSPAKRSAAKENVLEVQKDNGNSKKNNSSTKPASAKDKSEVSEKSLKGTGRGKRHIEDCKKTSTTEKSESKEDSQEADEPEAEQTVTRRSKRKRKDSQCDSQENSKSPKKEQKGTEKDRNSSKKKVGKSDGEDTQEDFEEEVSPERKQRKRKSTTSDGNGKGKKARKSKRKKKGETSEGEEEEEEVDDIDALFVSEKEDKDEDSDDVQIIDDPNKSEKEQKTKDKYSPKKDKGIKLITKDDNDEEEEEENDEDKDGKGRHNIRKLMTGKKLTEETKAAAKAEKDRRERVVKEHEKHLIEKAIDPKTKIEICTKLVLAFKEGTKKPAVEVLPKLVKKLKPHQVEAVEFMWDNLIECLDKLNDKNPGQGCILAHCMGLGKTLSVIALVHTLLTSKAVRMKTCLVVCPLNTVLNWQYEWHKWLDKKDHLPTYELASCRDSHSRADLLAKWQKSGGIMIIGYSLFRILASYTGKSKKVKSTFDESLLDPGPDLVICDEGHILKNDASALSKWMSKIRSRRRVVLTGTPLQNNLVEYHCMANFVKPQLLGTRREFSNRFVNPITNGQHSDSTARDVKLMKRRAHVLHEMLAGSVQRRDYSALAKFLPPKEEYVISVRLSPLQIKLYRKYLETFRSEENQAANQTHCSFKIRGASLFTDYQALMRVWTHPWVLKLDALRQERKAFAEQDDELDSLDNTTTDGGTDSEDLDKSEDSEEEGLVIDTSDLSSAETSEATRSQPKRGKAAEPKKEDKSEKKKKKNVSKSAQKRTKVNGKTAKAEDDSSKMSEDESSAASDTEKTKVLGGEVIRPWKSTSRFGKQDAVNQDDLLRKDTQWWTDLIDEDTHKTMLELSGKLVLLFEILRMAEGLGDKVLVFSQSILSLDLIEEFLKHKDEEAQKFKGKKADKPSRWVKDEDYYRMDGSTGVQNRRKFTSSFNTESNDRMRLFLISTRAGGLGINLDSANRVIIFDASWNPSHDIQSIFRVYRFGQEKDVYVYRFVAQGTMEEKIYDRQVTKETLSQRVIDEHQIDRHFTANDLQELYIFKPDDLTDPDRVTPPVPKVPKDLILAELLSSHPEWIYGYHEHDSLLENRPEENLSEEERKAAWDEYERDKQGLITINNYQPRAYVPQPYMMPGPNIRPPVGGPATAQLSNLLTSITPYSQPQINMQIQQLPRVVKEILKYNPNITADELQVRLQSFLGMHTRFTMPSLGSAPQQPAPSGAPSVQPSSTSISSASSATTAQPRSIVVTQGVPAQGHLPRLVPAGFPNPMTLFPRNSLPSRLPTTGYVPALGKNTVPASKSLPHNVIAPKSGSSNAPKSGQSANSSQPTASTSKSS